MSERRVGSRGLRSVVSFLTAAGVALGTLAVLPAAAADKREEAAAAQEKAEKRIGELQHDLEGIDTGLANLFIEMETVNQQLPVVEAQLKVAEEELEAADRKYQQINDQLTVAEAENTRLEEELVSAKDEEVALNNAVGEMARDMYRGGTPSPLTIIMTADSAADISERTAAASTMARAQSNALETIRESMVVVTNQADKQQATTERITELQEAAATTLAAAEAAEAEVTTKHDELSTLKDEQVSKKAAWESQKAEAEKQLAQSEQELADAAARVAKIDEENRAKQQVFAPEVSSSTPTSGAMFQSPIRVPIIINSPFGYRIHPIFGDSRLHSGTDMAAGCGLEQYAIREGVVAAIEYDSGGGNMVYVNHGMIDGSSWTSIHMHLDSAAVSVGQSVGPSTVIGYTGTTGNSTGCHVHLSVLQNGNYIDPMDYL